MSIYETLKEKVIEYLEDVPYDILLDDGEQIAQTRTYELTVPRTYEVDGYKYSSRKIGAANLTLATTYVVTHLRRLPLLIKLKDNQDHREKVLASVWKEILLDLEKENFLRIVPEVKRETSIGLIVDNDREK